MCSEPLLLPGAPRGTQGLAEYISSGEVKEEGKGWEWEDGRAHTCELWGGKYERMFVFQRTFLPKISALI